MTSARRPLEDMVSEIAGSIVPIARESAVRPVSVDLALPVEARVDPGPDGLRVIADLPRLHTRTHFDLPIGRLTVRLAAMPAEFAT
ncbi:MAG TPA: hypothetical protein VFS87_07225 [Qipengyuania sp.]|nr:hypothetical protein [Qipengyuania sp.]